MTCSTCGRTLERSHLDRGPRRNWVHTVDGRPVPADHRPVPA